MHFERLNGNLQVHMASRLLDTLIVELEFANERLTSIEDFLSNAGYQPLERTSTKFDGYLNSHHCQQKGLK